MPSAKRLAIGLLMALYLLFCVIFFGIYFREKLTFWPPQRVVDITPAKYDMMYKMVPLVVATEPQKVITEGWFLPAVSAPAKGLTVYIPGVCNKCQHVKTLKRLQNVAPDFDLLVFDWPGYGSTQDIYPKQHQLFDKTLKAIHAYTKKQHYDRVIWFGHCIGFTFLVRHLGHLFEASRDRVFSHNGLINWFLSGVAMNRYTSWIPPTLTYVLPAKYVSELDIREDLRTLRERGIKCMGLYRRDSKHVQIENGRVLKELVEPQHYFEIEGDRYNRFTFDGDHDGKIAAAVDRFWHDDHC